MAYPIYQPFACVSRSDLLPLGGTKYAVELRGKYAPPAITPVETGQSAALSIQPDGSIQSRAMNAIAAWETGDERIPGILVYDDPAYPHPYALRIV